MVTFEHRPKQSEERKLNVPGVQAVGFLPWPEKNCPHKLREKLQVSSELALKDIKVLLPPHSDR
jgi:hypothetical protein